MFLPLASLMLPSALLTAGALGVACAVLSVVVVLRRWAFIGEGISHAGYGGIGTGWLLSLAVPALGQQGVVYAIAVVFCLTTAVAIGYVSRDYLARGGVGSDAAIGIFLVASLAWGYLALVLYHRHRPGAAAITSDAYLFGDIAFITPQLMIAGICLSAAVVVVVGMLWKEILAYTFDPAMARVGGVRVGLIHFLLMLLVALVIIIGMRLIGSVLMTALLVLPGATALLLSRRLSIVLGISVVVGLSGTVGGLAIAATVFTAVPSGPVIVMVMFAEFVGAYGMSRIRRA
jgi:ABC-type Mn2+/Zn2+ transport system permease subunit